jgi:transposase-like protein
MAVLGTASHEETEQQPLRFAMKCKGWIRRAEQQKARAREMIEAMQKMRDRAAQMRKPPRFSLLSFFAFPRHLWRKLRTTNVIERCFVEVRRRTRPMVCFVNVESVDRIIYSIFQRFNLEWKTRTLNLFTQAA